MSLVLPLVLAAWLGAWWVNARLVAGVPQGWMRLVPPLVFGVTLLLLWEILVRGLEVSPVLLPAPTAVFAAIAAGMADAPQGRGADLPARGRCRATPSAAARRC